MNFWTKFYCQEEDILKAKNLRRAGAIAAPTTIHRGRRCVRCVRVCGRAGAPEEWMSENVGALLYLCGDDICVKVLLSKAINGRVLELAGVIVSLCVVCVRQTEPMTWAVVVLRRVLTSMDNARDRGALLHAVVDTFRDNVADLHDFFADDPSKLL